MILYFLMSAEYRIRLVDEQTYNRESPKRIKYDDTTLTIGRICIARHRGDLPEDGFAFDTYARIDRFDEPDAAGYRVMGIMVIDADGRNFFYNGQPMYAEGIMGKDGFLRDLGTFQEEGYLLGSGEEWFVPADLIEERPTNTGVGRILNVALI